jgi:3-ketosteroid 9alpha-monooxygenase subunit A
MTTLVGYVGPGVAFGRFLEAHAQQIICVTPIDDGSCRLWQAAMVKAPDGADTVAARAHQQRFNGFMRSGLLKDVEIWKHKRPALQIMQLASDGPFWQSRTWYSQFHQPRARTADILKRVSGVHTAKGMPAFTPTIGSITG